MPHRIRLDIVCSGTGPSFYSMLGACAALYNLRSLFKVERVACTSGSSIPFGLLFAAGLSLEDVMDLTMNLRPKDYLFHAPLWTLFKDHAWFNTDRMEKLLLEKTNGMKLRDAKIDFVVNGTHMDTGDMHVFSKWNEPDITIAKMIRITTAMPGIFEPVQYKGHYFLDGGIYQNLLLGMWYGGDNTRLAFIEEANLQQKQHIQSAVLQSMCRTPLEQGFDKKPHLIPTLTKSLSTVLRARTESLIDLYAENTNIIRLAVDDFDTLNPSKEKRMHVYSQAYTSAMNALNLLHRKLTS